MLLRRTQTVHLDHLPAPVKDPRTAPRLAVLEGEFLDRGYALTAPLHAAFAALDHIDLAREGRQVLAQIDDLLGSNRTHTPLFQRFPLTVPADACRLFVDRMFALLLQLPEQPCVLCGEVGSVHPVSPCAHLVCRGCWDGSDYSGCPICHRRIDRDDPFLRPVPPARAPRGNSAPARTLRLLSLGADPAAEAAAAAALLMARQTPLSPQDQGDLSVLLSVAPAGLGWLPDDIPVRETKALVLGSLLRDPRTAAAVRPLLRERLTTATDVLRLLAVHSGGAPALLKPPRFRSLSRSLRRELLAVLDGLHLASLIEDLRRHPSVWKRAAESLHPYEQYARHPKTAIAFAVLRETDTAAFPELLDLAARHPRWVRAEGGRLRAVTWNSGVEVALAGRDLPTALRLLGQRPGELLRRLDHVLRLRTEEQGEESVPEPLAEALAHALPRAGVGPLLSALGSLRVRCRPGGRRVFFPRGEVTRAFATDEVRAPLPRALTGRVCALLEAEALRRLGDREPYDHAVIDSGLADLVVPFAEHASAKTLVAVPRGSTQPLPEGDVLRLFLHWTQPADRRVDLDLSVALFDAEWRFTGLCDYTSLVHAERAAVHSGDLTSAPAPHGATEYVDLDLPALAASGSVYAMPIVFSFNNVAFDELLDAFAGFMELHADGPRDSSYDPRTVRQRFDLAGESLVCVPMLVDLRTREALWTDLHLPPAGGFQSIRSHTGDLGRIARDLSAYFRSGSRTTLWDLAVWHACARTREVTVVRRDGELWTYHRRPDEDPLSFAARLTAPNAPDLKAASAGLDGLTAGRRVLLAQVHGSAAGAGATGTSYRLFPGPVDGQPGFERVTAGDLVAELGPELSPELSPEKDRERDRETDPAPEAVPAPSPDLGE
ncbi:MXAN_6230/SCO0854 family RING domain-containing protein [Streptomyces sp. NPDC051907]|uniref:MXAN_6230/SCO0854 family RING domain-containing protein n=1 Tax=Streptomyces sp. NPDC051907 TaxID=3155284 RepID=UPI003434111D